MGRREGGREGEIGKGDKRRGKRSAVGLRLFPNRVDIIDVY